MIKKLITLTLLVTLLSFFTFACTFWGEEEEETKTTETTEKKKEKFKTTTEIFKTDNWNIVVGQVENTSDSNIENVEISVKLIDEDGEVVEVKDGDMGISRLEKGEKAPFFVWTSKDDDFSEAEVTVTGDETNREFYREFKLANDKYTPPPDQYSYGELIGEVENTGDLDATGVSIAISYFDEDGDLVASGSAWPDEASIAAGEKSTFNVTLDYNLGKIDTYEVQIDCYEYSDTE